MSVDSRFYTERSPTSPRQFFSLDSPANCRSSSPILQSRLLCRALKSRRINRHCGQSMSLFSTDHNPIDLFSFFLESTRRNLSPHPQYPRLQDSTITQRLSRYYSPSPWPLGLPRSVELRKR